MTFTYYGGPLDGQTYDAEAEARKSLTFPKQEGDVAIPVGIMMDGGTYTPDFHYDPPRLVWRTGHGINPRGITHGDA